MYKLINLSLVLLVMFFLCPAPVPAQAASEQVNPANMLLQFTGGGHVLGFSESGIYVAAGDHALKVEFINGSSVHPVTEAAVSGQNGVAPLDKVTYSNVWENVDICYGASARGIVESTYYLNNPASIDSIRLRYNHPISLDARGNLVISFENGNMVESAPIAWQEIAGQRKPVAASFVLYNGNELGFALGNMVPGVPVVIDPTLAWTYTVPNGDSTGYSIALDSAGNVYIAGQSHATWGSPKYAHYGDGQADVFVAKLNSNGILQWNTFLGGLDEDEGGYIALDPGGNIFVAGTSHNSWQRTSAPVRAFTVAANTTDAFVAKLNNDGDVVWNTFLGGSHVDRGHTIVVDLGSSVYVGGYSTGAWPETAKRAFNPGGSEGFVAKLIPDGSLQWHGFLGGPGDDNIQGITMDVYGNIYVAGHSSIDWTETPVRGYSAMADAFVAKLKNNGTLLWHTFLGGNSDDIGSAIAVDPDGNLYVGGTSYESWGSPLRAFAGQNDAFAAKLDNGGNLLWHTFLGGSGGDWGTSVALLPGGGVYIAGYCAATWGNPVTPYNALWDGFAAMLDNNGALRWNTFLGGPLWDFATGVVSDSGGNIYLVGALNNTWSTADVFAAKISGAGLAGGGPTSVNLNTSLGTVGVNTDAGSFVNAGWLPTANIRCSAPSGYFFPYGMFSFTISNLTAGQKARITLRFPNPLPLGAKYYKCINGSMVDCTSLVTRINEYTLQLALTDGGLGDSDGVANGVIIDPGGPAFPLNTPSSHQSSMPVKPQSPVSLSNISVKSASLSATRVTPGTPVTVTASVSNTGTGNGTSVVKVYVNGSEETSQGVTVNSGGTTQVSFDVSRNEPGTYTVYVGGTNAGSFTVDQFTPDTMLYISGALVFFAFSLGVIWMARRRA